MAADKLDTEIRREQIAQAALGLIATKGIKGLEMAEIAKQVGIVPSALYRHFGGKDEIIEAVLDLIRDGMIGNVAAVCEETGDPLERLEKLAARQIGMVHLIPVIPQIIYSGGSFDGVSERRAKVHDRMKRYLAKIREIIVQGQTAGEIRKDLDSETLALMLLGNTQQSALMWFLSGGKFNAKKHAKKVWGIYKEAIAVKHK